jgi:predicted metal-dependent enzyme (double-stranded beta helix superfamily)
MRQAAAALEAPGFPWYLGRPSLDWIDRIAAAVREGDPARITRRVQGILEGLVSSGDLELPEAVCHPRREGYARRLLHRDPELDYTVLVMAWGPGQGSLLHDHAGLWGVEIVVEGEMEVESYELLEQPEPLDPACLADPEECDLCRFLPLGVTREGAGQAGVLEPPREYHVVRNAVPDGTSITLHVYGGELDRCQVFLPEPDGRHRREERRLSYHEWEGEAR